MIKRAILALIKGYSYMISPLWGRSCRFYPTCSAYMHQAIEKYGVIKGGAMGVRRLCKCHPWYQGKFDDPLE